MACYDHLEGYITMPDGDPVSYDGLPSTAYRLLFPKLNNMVFFIQGFDSEGFSVNQVSRATPYVDINEIGEKIVYEPFTCDFLVDNNCKNYKEVYDWMKRMTVAGTNIDEVGDCILIINGKDRIRFIDAWPTSVTGLRFQSNVADINYISASATFCYDYIEFI